MSYHEGSNWQARKEDEGKPLYENPIKVEKTQRGFEVGKFKDRSGRECSIQESSIAAENCIWLGYSDIDRMHLSVEQVKALLPLLQNFVNAGTLSPDPSTTPAAQSEEELKAEAIKILEKKIGKRGLDVLLGAVNMSKGNVGEGIISAMVEFSRSQSVSPKGEEKK